MIEGEVFDEGGAQTISLLVRGSPEVLVVGGSRLDVECSEVVIGLFGSWSDNADVFKGKLGLCLGTEEWQAHELSEAGGGMPQAPLLSRCSMTIAMIGTSGSSSEVIDERNAEVIFVDGGGVPQVSMVNSPSMEV